MEITTFRDWLAEHGCRVHRLERGHGPGHPIIAVEREGQRAELPPLGPHERIGIEAARSVCEQLGLDWTQLPGPHGRAL